MRRHLLVTALTLVVVLGIAIFLAMPVSLAPFRLHAVASFVGLRVAADTHLSFQVTDWTLSNSPSGSARRSTTPASGNAATAASSPAPDRIQVWVHRGDELLLEYIAGEPDQFTLTLPSAQTEVVIQSSTGTTVVRVDADGKETPSEETGAILRARVGPSEQPVLHFSPAASHREVADRVEISQIGFGKPTLRGIDATLTSGGIVFLDKPEVEQQIFRGTDLRLGMLDAEASSLEMGSDGLAISVSGSTSDADVFVATQRSPHWSRSVMPTRYDWIKAQPVLAVVVGFFGILVSLAGVMLAIAQTFPAFGHWLARVARD